MTKPRVLRPELPALMPQTAMVMAAGLGKRMRPLTATRPKPLIQVAGKTLLDHTLDHLRTAGVKRAVVNVHYLADTLEGHLRAVDGIDITISDERAQLLETGGGLMKAKPLLGEAPIFVVNSDNYWLDGPIDALSLLAARWNAAEMDVLLLLVPLARAHCHRGQGDFHIAADGRITSRRRSGRLAPFVFIGVQILNPAILVDAPEGPFSTMLFWERAIAAGRAYGVVHQGLWVDVGTPAAVTRAEALLIDG
ncbi:MurNAc alpha-1-phosphate uridylyltransferase [Sphingomonas sp. OV641]|uniref:nucleotidyltransferase family protein n=1 Tax=Sphingomonas sp. OV641 TaxID=1881068 RepID=UPI0008B1DF50|nr:nucleotidyltransferase family protein [Sphingomonas sp. OV641]SEI98604.1 MurNAc alpha-1-phosphate uridylyltransferase [Sphingomonas sp. OV641]